MYKYIYIMSFV